MDGNRKQCDLVMKGGITSGVVYPRAVARLAQHFDFRSIGGTSAGAIAAALTAAAAHGRRAGDDRFDDLANLPRELGERVAGRTRLLRLFQPQAATAATFNVLLVLLGRPKWWRGVLELWRQYFWAALPGFIAGLLPLAYGQLSSNLLLSLVGLLVALVGLAGAVVLGTVTAAVAAAAVSWREIPRNGFGLCNGRTGADSAGLPALTDWMHEKIQRFAGRETGDAPLTVGDLWNNGGDQHAERDIDLVLMTTNVTRGISHQFPFLEEGKGLLYFKRVELERLFPKVVVQHMVEHAREGGPDAAKDYVRLPAPADLPVLFGARLSLSFPYLLSAVPLHSPQWKDGVMRMRPCWFSDGGLTSNFPMHLFDAAIPTRPTFGINLSEAEVADAMNPATRDENADPAAAAARRTEDDLVWMPETNASGQRASFASFDRTVGGFFGALVGAGLDWSDNELTLMPGYRDRIVHVRLRPHEGGLNLDMPDHVIDALARRGEEAAELLLSRFGPEPGDSPLNWDNQRWVRYRSMMAALEALAYQFEDKFDAGGYQELLDRPRDAAPSYPWGTEAQRDHALAATRQFLDFVKTWQSPDQTFDRNADNRAGRSPRPKPRLRVSPPSNAVPPKVESTEG